MSGLCSAHRGHQPGCAQCEALPLDREVQVIQVVRTELLRRGEGVAGDPVRRVEQFWSLDGRLLAENDHWKGRIDV